GAGGGRTGAAAEAPRPADPADREPDRRVPRALGVRVAAGRSQRPPAPRGGGPRPPHRSPALSSAEPIPPRSAVRTAAVPARTLRATEVVARALERIERTDRA